jgi:hypothetical protein
VRVQAGPHGRFVCPAAAACARASLRHGGGPAGATLGAADLAPELQQRHGAAGDCDGREQPGWRLGERHPAHHARGAHAVGACVAIALSGRERVCAVGVRNGQADRVGASYMSRWRHRRLGRCPFGPRPTHCPYTQRERELYVHVKLGSARLLVRPRPLTCVCVCVRVGGLGGADGLPGDAAAVCAAADRSRACRCAPQQASGRGRVYPRVPRPSQTARRRQLWAPQARAAGPIRTERERDEGDCRHRATPAPPHPERDKEGRGPTYIALSMHVAVHSHRR